MRKILVLVIALLFITSLASATMVATRVSGSMTAFGKLSQQVPTGSVVTFNSITTHIVMQNLSTTRDCWADIRCVNNPTGTTGHLTSDSAVIFLPAIGRATPNTVSLDFATRNLGFVAKSVTVGRTYWDEQVVYYVTGEQGDL